MVTDTGIGMTEEEMSIALQPFGRADSAVARSREGTGLGLSLSKGLVEAHGGTLSLESFPGSGTTVTVTLPAERVRTVSSPTDGASAPA
jgi:signal transduction histidine kinase